MTLISTTEKRKKKYIPNLIVVMNSMGKNVITQPSPIMRFYAE